jgi:hypothetical protein
VKTKIQKQFESELDKLFKLRTHWLRGILGARSPGKPPIFNRAKRKRSIEKLQKLATQSLGYKLARVEFDRIIDKKLQWHPKRGKGWGRDEKKRKFKDWFESKIPYSNCIYIFWAGDKCVYVGRSIRGKGRAASHFVKHWFGYVTRIDVYSTSRASEIPKLECLAIHRFEPRENQNHSARVKWTKKCPVCEIHKDIKEELRSIFNFR